MNITIVPKRLQYPYSEGVMYFAKTINRRKFIPLFMKENIVKKLPFLKVSFLNKFLYCLITDINLAISLRA